MNRSALSNAVSANSGTAAETVGAEVSLLVVGHSVSGEGCERTMPLLCGISSSSGIESSPITDISIEIAFGSECRQLMNPVLEYDWKNAIAYKKDKYIGVGKMKQSGAFAARRSARCPQNNNSL